uniref:Cystatin domain-containing protein n=1 Tax=Denticeps clupeoides TaxID=299321 RepID=A0AAY4BBU4_9TELE
ATQLLPACPQAPLHDAIMSPRPLLSSCLLCLALATAGGTPGCRDRPVGETAEDALRQLNADRDTGYVLGLQQIHDVGVEPREGGGSLYNLVLDVSETDCHVVSRKNWTSCRIRSYSDLQKRLISVSLS